MRKHMIIYQSVSVWQNSRRREFCIYKQNHFLPQNFSKPKEKISTRHWKNNPEQDQDFNSISIIEATMCSFLTLQYDRTCKLKYQCQAT